MAGEPEYTAEDFRRMRANWEGGAQELNTYRIIVEALRIAERVMQPGVIENAIDRGRHLSLIDYQADTIRSALTKGGASV